MPRDSRFIFAIARGDHTTVNIDLQFLGRLRLLSIVEVCVGSLAWQNWEMRDEAGRHVRNTRTGAMGKAMIKLLDK